MAKKERMIDHSEFGQGLINPQRYNSSWAIMSDTMDGGPCRSVVEDTDVGLCRLAMLNMDMDSHNYPSMNRMQCKHEGGKIEVYRGDRRARRPPKDMCSSCEVFLLFVVD